MTVIAANTSSYGPYPVERALEGISHAGYRAVELCAAPKTDVAGMLAERKALTELLTKWGLQLTAITADADVATDEGLTYARTLAGIAAELHVPILNVAVGNGPAAKVRDLFCANIHALLESTRDTSVVVCVEPHGDLTATGQQAARILRDGLCDAAMLTYDTANVEYYGGKSAAVDLPQVVDEVAHVHLKDKRGGRRVWDFPPLGEGHVDLSFVLATLERARYSGVLSIEVEFRGEPWPEPSEVDLAMQASLIHLRSLGHERLAQQSH